VHPILHQGRVTSVVIASVALLIGGVVLMGSAALSRRLVANDTRDGSEDVLRTRQRQRGAKWNQRFGLVLIAAGVVGIAVSAIG
jgi:hypothetical protein